MVYAAKTDTLALSGPNYLRLADLRPLVSLLKPMAPLLDGLPQISNTLELCH